MRLSLRFLFVVTLTALLVLVQGGMGQEVTAGIIGTVVDASGAPIQGATATARDVNRGTERTATTNETGTYNITRLPVGTYELKVSAPGFQTAVRPAFTLVLNQTAELNVQMKVGQVAETVEVSGAAPVLQTQTTELSTVIDARANEALPLATRNYNQLTLLAPGSVSTNPGAFTGPQASFQVGRPYVNGNREQTNNYILDGMDNNQIDNNDVAYAPSVDAIQEFNLITQNASAEFGNYLGGLVSVTLKSGSNNWHGSVFEFFRNDALNANTWANGLTRGGAFVPGKTDANGVGLKPLLRWNEFGGTVGGPVIKDKLFFFADYQGSRFDQPGTSNNFGVLTTAERHGDFSAICTAGFTAGLCNDPAQRLFNPFSSNTAAGRTPFLNNQIPANLISRAASNIVNSPLYPAPVTEDPLLQSSNQSNFTHSSTNSDQGDLKIDWNATNKDHIFGRYSQQSVRNPTTNSQVLLGDSLNTFPLQNLVVDWTRTINSSVVNDARVGYSYFPVTEGFSNPTGQNLGQLFGVAGVPDEFLPVLQFGGVPNQVGNAISDIGNRNLIQSFHDTVIKFEDTATWTRGRHVFHTGFQAFRFRTNIFYPGNEGVAGNFGFTGQFTGNPTATNGTDVATGIGAADFLLGLPTTLGVGANAGNRYLNNSLFAVYGQDNWRITDRVTLNFGLRWDLNTPRTEAQGRITNYDLITGQVFLGNEAANYKQYNGITNFQPRIGIAWQPSWVNNTVVRAAFSMSNFSESTGTGNLLFQNPPFTIAHNITNVGLTLPTSTFDQGFSNFPASPCTPQAALASAPECFTGAAIHLFDPNFRPAVSRQWNLSVQHQFGNSTTVQVGYVGQHVDHLVNIFLLSQQQLNPDGTTSPSPFLVGNPALKDAIGQARLTASGAVQNYNALQATFQQRLTRGLQFQANYTWSKCLTNSSGFFAEFGDTNPGLTQAGNDYFFVQNTLDPNADYGRCSNDVASLFNGYVTYDLPFGRKRAFGANINPVLNAILGDWQVNSIFNLHSGFAITAQAPDQSGTGSGFPRADCIGPPRQGSHDIVTVNGVTGLQWLDPSSVAVPALGTFGNCSVGSFRGPGLRTMDLSLSKFFPITERQSLEFRAEAINFTNTPIFAHPIDVKSLSSAFGVVTQAQGERNIQFGLKYRF